MEELEKLKRSTSFPIMTSKIDKPFYILQAIDLYKTFPGKLKKIIKMKEIIELARYLSNE